MMISAERSPCPRIHATRMLWCLLLAVSGSVSGFAPAAPLRSFVSSPDTRLHLYQSVEEAIGEAERICAMNPNSNDCKVAWDIVEELEAADSHRGPGNPMEHHQPMPNNQADIGAFLASLDILISKIDGKMDQLKATSYKLQELGASDPAIANLAYRADEMKQAMMDARNSLR